MPVVLNPVSGELDASIVDGNFEELETFLKENIKDEDFDGKFNKFKVRRYTSGKIIGFNAGSSSHSSSEMTGVNGTFENNWISGAAAITFVKGSTVVFGFDGGTSFVEDVVDALTDALTTGSTEGVGASKNSMEYNHPVKHPFELLGYPGGSMYYDFQEQGFADPVSYYQTIDGAVVTDWPPTASPMGRFPKDECWSRWLTVPDAAGGVYVDEPCVAVITAQVKGNYFMTPALRVHGTNTTRLAAEILETYDPDEDDLQIVEHECRWHMYDSNMIGEKGVISEGMQESAFIRLGLFVDTNPIVWDDEFFNGNSFGEPTFGSGYSYNPWIGDNPTGQYAATRPDGVSKTRSWIKVTDLTQKVKQRASYKVIGVIQLKGRRRYNFSLKFRPAMTFGYVVQGKQGTEKRFVDGYWELSGASRTPDLTGTGNPAWNWGELASSTSVMENYCFPGGDALVTNLIESSSISVEFFYGQTLSEVQAEVQLVTGADPDLGV